MMLISDTSITLDNQTTNEPTSNEPIITTSTNTSTSISSSMWKVYENPFYQSYQPYYIHHSRKQFLQNRNLVKSPITPRKRGNSYWDVRFIGSAMDSDLDRAKAKIVELKAELEFERRARKKMESVNKKLVRELSEERQGRETLERICGELGKKVSENTAEISKMKKEIGEERKMLRMAEVFREERVQMKLSEAKFLLEEKIQELERNKLIQNQTKDLVISSIPEPERTREENENSNSDSSKSNDFSREELKYVSEEKLSCNCDRKALFLNQRKPSPEPENPHIKRGIKGFVEFPKVVKAIGSRNRHVGTKLECQKAQLNLLLKQKSPMRTSTSLLITS